MQTDPTAIRHVVKGSGTYSLALIASRGTSFLLFPLYTRYLTPADYGALELLSLTSFILTTLVFMRLGDALFYFHTRAGSVRQAAGVVWTIFITSLLMGALCGAAGWSTSSAISKVVFNTPAYAYGFRLVFVAAAFSFTLELGYAYLRLFNRSRYYVLASLLNLALGVTCNIILLVTFRLGLLAMLWSSIIATALTAVLMAAVICRDVWAQASFSAALARRVIGYSFPLGFSGMGMFILNFGDRYFLQRHVTLAEVGIYAVAYKIGMLISYLQSPFDTYWRSQMYAIMDGRQGEWLYIRVCTYLASGLGLFAVALSLFSSPLLHVAVPPAYWPAATLIPWIAAAYVIRAVGAQFRCAFFLTGRTNKELLVSGSGGLVCLAAYAVSIPRYGVWGAVGSTILGFTWMCIFGFWQAQRVRRFAFEYRRMAVALACGVIAVALFQVCPVHSPWLQLCLAVLLLAAYLSGVFLCGFLAPDEKERFRALSRMFLQRRSRAAVSVGV